MAYYYALADHGRTLATRSLAEELRSELVKVAAGEETVVLDLAEIRAASHSFADEFVACLAEEVTDGKVGFAVTVSGATPDVERVLRRALERRGAAIPALV